MNILDQRGNSKMLIVKFQGALGNQMFEYALLKRLEKVYPDSNIKAHIGNIKDFNGYELDRVFGLEVDRADWKQVAILSNDYPAEAPMNKLMNKFCRFGQIKNGGKESHMKQDDNTAYYNQLFTLNPLRSYYLDGVWANSMYIEEIRDELIHTFQFCTQLEGINLKISEDMKNENSVCIHVRRNEYVSMGLTVTSDNYYKKAIDIMKNKIDNPSFYIFSDDHEYCRKLFSGLIDYKLVEGNKGENSYKDMQLMTFCKHNIIANSTFSFWGAYLNNYSEKLVIAPNISWGNMKHPFARSSWMVIDAK